MLITVSPAKTLDFDTQSPVKTSTEFDFHQESQTLISQLKHLEPDEIASLMGISEKLGLLNWERFQTWEYPFPAGKAKQAVFAFKGDVYTGLEAETLSPEGLHFAQQHLRILSGLYGLLRPLDLILPYRLEMGTKFKNEMGANLYRFWGDKITDKLNETFQNIALERSDECNEEDEKSVLINLASNEYFKVVNKKKLNARIITPVFKDLKNGQYKIISFYAKKARGLMTAFICENQLTEPELIKDFDTAGYAYNAGLSDENTWVFTRDRA